MHTLPLISTAGLVVSTFGHFLGFAATANDAAREGDVWIIPADAMKGRKDATQDFRVPLGPEALAILDDARRYARDGFLFPSIRKGVISDATMSRLMERRGMAERPHGFRSSLRDWIAEVTDAPHDVAETMLGHVVGGAVERAYRRTDFLEQRRALLARWAHHVTGGAGQVESFVGEPND